jgi:tellurite resistance-related uncharacterized protein
MQRPIERFATDSAGEWVAELSCGHRQHVRHEPPFIERPWVTTEQGRAAKIGALLECLRCDRFEWPEGFVSYRKTAEFTEQSIPAALRHQHSTKPGVWAKIQVTTGRLIYRVDSLDARFELSAEAPGIVIPEVTHYVELLGPVRFYVEFYRADQIKAPQS